MGEVYRADDLELGQSVALKFLPQRVSGDPVALDRFRSEVRSARQIAHPNVCRMYDIGEVEGHVFLSMEYIDGEDLAHVLARMGRPSKEKSLEIARQLCLGLAAAHENGVLHRDLKPANIMIDGRGRVRITDFGLAGLVDELAEQQERVGTPAYMAPEQLEAGKVSVRSDIYSLGLVLYELFTGHRAFDTNNAAELKKLHSSGSFTPPSSVTHEMDPAVEGIIERCLEREPDQRPRSVYVVLGALPGTDPLAAALAAGETPSPDLVASAREKGALAPRWAVAMLATVVVLLGVLAVVQQRTMRDPVLGQDALSARATEIVRELGHELPTFTAGSLVVYEQFKTFVNRPGAPDWATVGRDSPLLYLYWRRWGASPLQAEEFHGPITSLADPRARPPGSVTIVLDAAGNLIELEVIPPAEAPTATTQPATEPDWSKALQFAGLEQAERQPAKSSRPVPAHCDCVVAWRTGRPLEDGGPRVFQAGAHHGRIVQVNTAWDWDPLGPIARAFSQKLGPREADLLPSLYFGAMNVLAVLLAWRNLRLGRGDHRGAIVMAFAVGVCYLLFELTGLPLHEFTFASLLDNLTDGRAIAHPLVHAFEAFLAYLAIEPYVRRIWPRSLIGWARLSQGRVRDPAVGRELLIGVFAALGFAGLMLVIGLAERWFGLRELDVVRARPDGLGNSARLGMSFSQELAITTLDTMYGYFFLAVVRLLTRRDWVSMIIAAALFTARQEAAGLVTGPFEWSLLWSDIAPALLGSLLTVFLLVRVGLIAGIMMLFAYRASELVPLTLNLSAPYAPQAMLGMAVIVLPALYGFWVALGGQPLFKDALLAEKPARA
jgi:serine/threonine-protein kinase